MGKLRVDEAEVQGKTVLVRVDFNVPLDGGQVSDDTRIAAALPTIRYLTGQGARVVLASHLGRPKGKRDPALSLAPVAMRLEQLLGSPVAFCESVVGPAAAGAVAELEPGGVLLLENLRFHAGEERNDPDFSRSLAELAHAYVSDAFGTVHRAHASIAGVASHFSQVACGFLIAKELEFLGRVLNQPLSPYVAILGGAKVGDKIQLVRSLLQRADTLLIGGAMAYTFLKALGHQVGASLLDEPHLELASQLLQEAADQGKAVLLPSDHLVASQATPEADVETCGVDIPEGRIGLDIGPESVARFQAALTQARMIVWNGPMGMFELPQFREGTFAIARAAADSAAMSLVGGGDSVAAVNQAGVAGRISHISTGGGASLKFLEGKSLPGIEVLTESGSPA
ncbi:MAG: phosphoglycerate kinase [SAR324 cluster bacterium]|nr:phosphoglycerate kinase [SAR324 cluster bacterium]